MADGIYQKDRCVVMCYLLDRASSTLRHKEECAPFLLYEYLLNAKCLLSETQRVLDDALLAVKPSKKPVLYQVQGDGVLAKSRLGKKGWSGFSTPQDEVVPEIDNYLQQVELIRKDRVSVD